MRTAIVLAASLLLHALATAGQNAGADESGIEMSIVSPEPGSRVSGYDPHSGSSFVKVDLHIAFSDGPGADRVRADPAAHQICYTGDGGRSTVCSPLGGEGPAQVIDVRDFGAGVHEAELLALSSSLPPDTRVSADSARLGATRVDTSGRGGLGLLRAWLCAAGAPGVGLGPGDAVYVWEDPVEAEAELRRRLVVLETCCKDGDSCGSCGGGSGSGSGGNDIHVESRGALQYHLGLCLVQQLQLDAGGDGGGNGGGRFVELVSGAAEALGRAAELGVGGAAEELRLLKAAARARDSATAGSSTGAGASALGPGSPQGSGGSGDDADYDGDDDDDDGLAALLGRVALVTITNAGYADYTLNAMASLRSQCSLPCVLQAVCLDASCHARLSASPEVRGCPETVHLAASLLAAYDDMAGGSSGVEGGGSLSKFASYNTPGFNAIVRYKFAVIRHFLGLREVVVFTDGDIVFLKRSFLGDVLRHLDEGRRPTRAAARSLSPMAPRSPVGVAVAPDGGPDAAREEATGQEAGLGDGAEAEGALFDVVAQCDTGHDHVRVFARACHLLV